MGMRSEATVTNHIVKEHVSKAIDITLHVDLCPFRRKDELPYCRIKKI